MSTRPNRVEFVVQKYRLAESTYIEAEEGGRKLGHGPVMADATLQSFMDGDPSGNFKYLDWMIFQAGGGQDAMEKSLQLWEGDSAADPNSLRNQCRADFIEEQVNGYVDEHGIRHAPVSGQEADSAWKRWEERSKFEFVMGDQDVAAEEGYGFYRNWPGKDGHYLKIVNAVKLWHIAQPKLLAQNQRYERYLRLRSSPVGWTKDDVAFMAKCKDSPPTNVVLDIYAGWKPKEFSQKGAIYKSLGDLLRALAEMRKMQVLRDVRHDLIYEDDNVLAVCPLTIGASIKFGIGKWCVSNKTDFERAFDMRGTGDGNWQRYCRMGPLVFLCWKRPMPPWLHKIAVHLNKGNLSTLNGTWTDVSWIDCQNQQSATSFDSVRQRIAGEAHEPVKRLRRLDDNIGDSVLTSDERYYQWGGRQPGPAWTTPQAAAEVTRSLLQALAAVRMWAPTFKTSRIVLDYLTDIGAE